MADPRPCPGCKRPNAPHRRTCLYCGHVMPNPTAPPSAKRRDVPKNLDAIFRRAMNRGSTSELKQVLEDIEEVEVAAPSPDDAPTDPPGALVQKEATPEHETTPEELVDSARFELGDWEEDPGGALQRVNAARTALQRLAKILEATPRPPEVLLPPFRQAFALLVETSGDQGEQGAVADALELDLPTARMVALSKHPRVARRGNSRAELERFAERWRAGLARAALVFDEETLRAQPMARTALELPAEGPWTASGGALWLDPEGPKRPRDIEPFEVRLLVSGEVVIKRFRIKRDKRGNKELSPSSERRLTVLDLHGDACVLRVVEGLTRLTGWGLEGLSHRQELKSLTERLGDAAEVLVAKRICQPTRKPEEAEGWAEAAGWPAWEEHSRACRLLFG